MHNIVAVLILFIENIINWIFNLGSNKSFELVCNISFASNDATKEFEIFYRWFQFKFIVTIFEQFAPLFGINL